MYGQFSPEHVYETLLKFNTSYIILDGTWSISSLHNVNKQLPFFKNVNNQLSLFKNVKKQHIK